MAVGFAYPEGTHLKELTIEAVGESFAMLSGCWLQSARVAQYVQNARMVWAFAVRSQADAVALAEQLGEHTGLCVAGLAPGMHPDWPAEDRCAILGILSMTEEATPAYVAGLLIGIEEQACGCSGCPSRQSGCTRCKGCDGTKDTSEALYCCNKAQHN